ncbi:hypothetical protein J1605_016062 [Eschrichtius robustus]|uniref:Uncharacterized protein n=1 Tax=Eschrichtius robustus TaxID=9764 RepID=A0AB34G9Z7_ESCRO|nr:hypothetical protein J1605_016062 [Eschrichtius robustus]
MKCSIFHFNLCGFLKVIQLLKAGKAKEVSYNALASHIISEDGDNPEVGEAREVFDLPVVKVRLWVGNALDISGTIQHKALYVKSGYSKVSARYSLRTCYGWPHFVTVWKLSKPSKRIEGSGRAVLKQMTWVNSAKKPSWVILSVQCGALLPYPFCGRGEGKDGFSTEVVITY